MSAVERQRLRNMLQRHKFTRTGYGPDQGDGQYWEEWTRIGGSDTVRIEWGPKT